MLTQRVKRKLKRFTAGLLSMAMILTMIPEIWLPIYAENVSQDIMNAEITTVSEITEEPVSNETMTSNSESEETDNNINTDISETETSENSDNIEASTEETTAVIDNNYAIFSGSSSQGLNLYGWKSFFTGNIYTGNIFNYGGSELYITGKVDAVSAIVSNGWITEIAETNEYVAAIPMPDYDEAINTNVQPCEYYETSPAYIQDKTVLNSSIKVNGDVTISGTTFEGDCYIIAEGNITYNVESFNTTGRVFLYSRNGNVTINGSQININGAMYAPNGNVTFNTYDTTVTGFICADTINFNGSLFNVSAANFDMVQPRACSH